MRFLKNLFFIKLGIFYKCRQKSSVNLLKFGIFSAYFSIYEEIGKKILTSGPAACQNLLPIYLYIRQISGKIKNFTDLCGFWWCLENISSVL